MYQYNDDALNIFKAELLKPVADPSANSSDDIFDPWRPFEQLYGSYSSAFDDMALEVLTRLLDPTYEPETLAHEMFREMLCTLDLCDYGTSPRGCFAREEFKDILPELISKWREYYQMQWVD